MHARIHPYDYYRDAPTTRPGSRKAAALIAKARAEAPNSMLLDNGDIIQGSPLGDWAARRWPPGGRRPSDDRRDERTCVMTPRASAITSSTTACDVLDSAMAGGEFSGGLLQRAQARR